MRILLISPVRDPAFKKPFMLPQLALHLIAGLTPREHEVKIIEEEMEAVNLDEECDLVGLSCMTSNAPRAYYLAQEFRKRGKTVVLGGVHPTVLPDEASRYADSVVVGEAEGVWEQLIEDFGNGRLQKRYHKPFPSLERYILLKNRTDSKKRPFGVIPVMTTRGCPYNCEFCCVHDLYGRKIRHVPIKNVVRDIVDSGRRSFVFLDDNIIGDTKYAKELFIALKPMNMRWVGQASLSFVGDTEMIKLAAESGCVGLFFGLETVSKSQLEKMRKSLRDIPKIEEAIRKVKDLGIHFHASMVFGFDDDTKDVFPETLDFLSKNRIGSASLNILTPYPGTTTYQKFQAQKRILTNDWRYYDHSTAVFQPKNMTPLELQMGRLWAVREFTKISETVKRLPSNLSHPFLHLALNSDYRHSILREIKNLPKLASTLGHLDSIEVGNMTGKLISGLAPVSFFDTW